MKCRKFHRIWSISILVIFLSVLAFLVFRARISPIIEDFAITVVEDRASDVIVEAVDHELEGEQVDYSQLVFLEKDIQGNITALRTNTLEINKLKVAVLNELRDRITRLGKDDLSIALGNLILPELFSGRGPRIPVRILSVTASDAQFASQLLDAGINQTLHQIIMNVTVTVMVLLPTGTIPVNSATEVVISETVLIGTVPNSYVNFTGQPLTEE